MKAGSLWWLIPVGLVACGVAIGLVSVPSVAVPVLSVDRTEIDFGVVGLDTLAEPRVCRFILKNSGRETLNIKRLQASCACTKLDLSASQLAPLTEGILTTTVTLPGKPGLWRSEILVYSDDPHTPVTKLSIIAMVRYGVLVAPSTIEIHGLRHDETRAVTLDVYGPTHDDKFTVLSASANSQDIAILPIQRAGHSEQLRSLYRVPLAVKARGERTWKAEVTVATSDPQQPYLSVPVFVQEEPAIKVSPAVVTLKRTRHDAEAVANFEVVSAVSGTPSAEILECPDWAAVEIVDDSHKDEEGLAFLVRTDGESGEGVRNGRIVLCLSPGNRRVEIPVVLFQE